MAILGSTHRICPPALAFLHEIQNDHHEDSIHALTKKVDKHPSVAEVFSENFPLEENPS